MKLIKLSLPFAFFMLMGSTALAGGVSTDALRSISNLIHSTKEINNNNGSNSNSKSFTQQSATNIKQAGQCPEHYSLGAPIFISTQKEKQERRTFYLCRVGYAVAFDPATKTPLWSAERLNSQLLSGAKEPRTDDFQQDPEVPGPAQGSLNDYKGSHFDRGHMAPAADQTGRPNNAMSQSFYLTNMVPQVGMNQNRGIWADLEGQVRQWSQERGEVLVVSGPIYDQGTVAIGKSQIWVPTRLYKVLIDPRTMESIAFIIPNRQIVTRKTKQLDSGNPQYPQTLPEQAIQCPDTCKAENFVVPIASVEQVTGLRFFSGLKEIDHQNVTQAVRGNWKFKR